MHGFSQQERLVMALWDAGVAIELIACRLRIKTRRVRWIVSYYTSDDDQRRDAASIAAGSAALVSAIEHARSC